MNGLSVFLSACLGCDHSKLWPPRKMPEAGSTAKALSDAIPGNSDSLGLPAGENKGLLCWSLPSLGGARAEWQVSRSGRVAWPLRAGMPHKVTFQGRVLPPGLGSHADSAELSRPCVCWEERRENAGWDRRGAPIPGETGYCLVPPPEAEATGSTFILGQEALPGCRPPAQSPWDRQCLCA